MHFVRDVFSNARPVVTLKAAPSLFNKLMDVMCQARDTDRYRHRCEKMTPGRDRIVTQRSTVQSKKVGAL